MRIQKVDHLISANTHSSCCALNIKNTLLNAHYWKLMFEKRLKISYLILLAKISAINNVHHLMLQRHIDKTKTTSVW